MRPKAILLSGLAALALLALAFGPSLAQSPAPRGDTAAQEALGTAFSYQGQLRREGSPYSGTCDFRFRLYDAASNGAQVGTTQTKSSVSVSNGLFLIPDLDFGSGAFRGDARWLEVAVKCTGDADFTTLSPRQALTPVPYALYATAAPWSGLTGVPAGFADGVDNDTTYSAGTGLLLAGTTFRLDTAYTDGRYWKLGGNSGTTPGKDFVGTADNQPLEVKVNAVRALRLEPDRVSPNLIGGQASNTVTSGVSGATVGGGGSASGCGLMGTAPCANRVTDDFGVVGGGRDNQAGDNAGTTTDKRYATVGGGAGNVASGAGATIGGGLANRASGSSATVAGGEDNAATGPHGAVGGGRNNTASDRATIGGGEHNTASGFVSTVAGGQTNMASGPLSAIGGGSGNNASADWAFIGGRRDNTASDRYATVAGGAENAASAYRATVGGGSNNIASGQASTVGGGISNTASGSGATIPGGSGALANHPGQWAYASGSFAAAGDAQTSLFVLRGVSTGSGWTDLYLDGASTLLSFASGRTVSFDILVVGRSNGGESAGYRIQGVFESAEALANLVGTAVRTTLGEDDSAWDATVNADVYLRSLRVQVKGNGETIRWVATVRTTEVAW